MGFIRAVVSSAAIVASLLDATSAQLVSTGLSITLNGVYYYIPPFAAGSLTNVDSSVLSRLPGVHGFRPVTVVQSPVAKSDLTDLFTNWTKTDDVFQSGFLDAVFLAGGRGSDKRVTYKNVSSHILPLKSKKTVPSGPYFLEISSGTLYPVFRLYDDFAGAFLESLVQTPKGTFQTLSAQVPGSASLTIGVPSRLYYTKTAKQPLAGVRIGVKDIYYLDGVKASNGNRAWYNLYPENNVTGPAIQRLIDAGAQIIGLQKPSQFANGEEATADWVDYHSPFNPRGDGYQDPSSSSSGAGASIASYDWLDIAVGSDTGGSIRGPSGVQGIFGNRPSHGLVPLDHVMPLSTALDTAGFLTRDPYLWDAVQAVVYETNYTSLADKKPSYPKTIYTLGFPANDSVSAAAPILNDFASSLADFVGGKVESIVLDERWNSSKPDAAGSYTLTELLNTTYPTLISKEQTNLVRDPFYKDYAAVHDGRLPFVDPAPLARWAYGDSLPASALDDAVRNKTLFKDWFNSKILPPVDDELQCSSGFLLYAGSTGSQNPRNEYIDPPTPPFGFSSGRISVFSECPDFVYPLGQVPGFSTITNHTEYLPVAVDILAAKGCDGLLVKLAQDLTAAGILAIPKVGGTITGGDILMKKRATEMGMKNLRYVN